MNELKKVTIITISLVLYKEILSWGLYTDYSGLLRKEIRYRGAGGKQVPFAFKKALEDDGDILIVADDKFNLERNQDMEIPHTKLENFLKNESLPKGWLAALHENNALHRIVLPPDEFACTQHTFSEKKLLALSRDLHGLPGECANEWTHLLEYLEKAGYKSIDAYIPKACAKGVCYSTPYAQESGIWVRPIKISFTDGADVVSTLKMNEVV